MSRQSRLSTSLQKRSRNTFILSIIGIIIIVFLLLRYGIPILSDASFYFGRVANTFQTNESLNIEDEQNQTYVPTPRLDPIPSATNENIFTIEGQTLAGLEVEIHLNGEVVGITDTDENGFFEYEITLTDGDNIIKARAINGESKGSFTRSKTITYKDEGPDLIIESPKTGDEIKGQNPSEIRGTTDPDSTVTVNDFQAIINSKGNWSYFLTLREGQNEIKVISTDPAGNETEELISVQYSP